MSAKAENESKGKAPGFTAKISRYYRDMKSELKKVVWPSKKQVVNNTVVVMIVVAVCGLFIGGFDVLLQSLVTMLFGA